MKTYKNKTMFSLEVCDSCKKEIRKGEEIKEAYFSKKKNIDILEAFKKPSNEISCKVFHSSCA